MKKEAPAIPQQSVEVDLIVDQAVINGEVVFKNKTPSIKVAKWLADSMVVQGVAKLKGVK